METVCPFEALQSTYKSTRRYNSEQQQHIHRREKLRLMQSFRSLVSFKMREGTISDTENCLQILKI
jgi:glutamine synthetase adenylyltransferase